MDDLIIGRWLSLSNQRYGNRYAKAFNLPGVAWLLTEFGEHDQISSIYVEWTWWDHINRKFVSLINRESFSHAK